MSNFSIESDGSRIVTLEKGYTGHKGHMTTVRLRPPVYKDFMDLGDPTTLIVSASAVVPQEDMATIRTYISRLSDADALLFENQLSLKDAMALKGAVLSFFAEKSVNTSPISPIT